MEKQFDVAVIGAGPGGYVAAIRAAQLGLSACVIEKDTPGGVCLNWGCIPSKSLIHNATEFASLSDIEALGVIVDRSGFRYGAAHARSRAAAKTLADGVSGLLRKNRITVIKARARIAGPGLISLSGEELPTESVRANNIIVATGSRPLSVPGFALDEKSVLSSSGILAMTELPKSIVILGAGAIGCEFAYVLNAFGVSVTLVEMGEHILPAEDFEVAQVLDASFRKRGIAIHTDTRATAWTKDERGLTVRVIRENKEEDIHAERILAAVGRTPNTENIGLEEIGVTMNPRGYVETGDYGQTNISGIFAIGDITTTPALAHVASREGEIAVEFIAGHGPHEKRINPDLVPSAVYCEPQVAGFGLREDAAGVLGARFTKSVFPFRGTGKSVAIGKTEGLAKVLSDSDTGEILGAHIVGSGATEMIHELLLAKNCELVAADIAQTIHAHPTLSEAIMEAARGIDGKPIHI